MRANKLYYKIYFIGLNTFFGSILPMFILIYLNTSTIVALYKMGHSPDAAGGDLTNGQQPLRPILENRGGGGPSEEYEIQEIK